MAENVETAVYRLQIEGQAQLEKLVETVDGLAIQEDKATATIRVTSEALQNRIGRLDRLVGAQLEYAKTLQIIEAAQIKGVGTLDENNALLDLSTAKYEAQIVAINKAAAATENLRRTQTAATGPTSQTVGLAGGADAYAAQFDRMMTIAEGKAAQIAKNFGEDLDASMIAGTNKAARDSAAVFSEGLDKIDEIAKLKAQQAGKNFGETLDAQMITGTTKAARDSAAAFSEELDKIDNIAKLKAQQAGKNFQDTLNQAMRIGAAPGKSARESFQVFDEAGLTNLQKGAAGMQNVGDKTKLARYEMINLSYQIQDIIVGLASGQKILTVIIQQGSQVLGILTSAGISAADAFKQVGATVFNFITPAKAVAAAVAAIGAAALYAANQFDKLQVSSQRAISGAGARTGTSDEDINKFVSQTSTSGFLSTGMSNTEARKLAEGFTASGDIVISKLHDMTGAVQGFANQTGVSVDKAVDAFIQFGKDPVKAMQTLADAFGPMDQKAQDMVRSFVEMDDKTSAMNVILDAYSGQLKDAANNMSFLDKMTRALATTMGREMAKPIGLDTQIAKAKEELDALIAAAATTPPSFFPALSQDITNLTNKLIELQKKKEAALAATSTGGANDIANKANEATRALEPEIAQLEALRLKINQIQAAQAAGLGTPVMGAALTKAQNDVAAIQQSQAEGARYQEQVKQISAAWGDVGQSTALALQKQEDMLPVAAAVGGAEKMKAQYAADYAMAIHSGKTETEAAAIASMNMATTQAQINANAKETLFNLQNQAAVAGAVTGAEQMQAQAEATYNQLVHDGVSAKTAAAVAEQQLANAQAAATANVERQTMAVKDQTDMIIAQARGYGDAEAAAQAYRHAIEAGADETAAAALKAAMLQQSMVKTALAAQQLNRDMSGVTRWMADQVYIATSFASRAANEPGSFIGSSGGGGSVSTLPLNQLPMLQATLAGTSGGFSGALPSGMGFEELNAKIAANATAAAQAAIQPAIDAAAGGGVDAAIAALSGKTGDAYTSAVTSLYSTKIMGLTDNASKIAVSQKELAYLQSQPSSLGNLQQIESLKQSIVQLQQSTDTLNKTNTTTNELLSPYYTQDPRTSHIGFRSQGMAAGGYVDVPGGSSSNDNMLLTMPVASGERVYVDPMTGARGTGGGNLTINISSPVLIQGNANKDDVGRTMFQNNQNLAKQLRQAAQ